jgi:hypothetical protein
MPGQNDESASRSSASERLAHMRESLQRIVEPVRQEVEQIDARLTEVEAERHELLALKREAMAVIRAADPERARVKPGPKGRDYRANGPSPERVRVVADAVESFMREHGDDGPDGEGVTQTYLDEQLPGMSGHTIRPAIELLIDGGVLRLDKMTRGGGKAYRMVMK